VRSLFFSLSLFQPVSSRSTAPMGDLIEIPSELILLIISFISYEIPFPWIPDDAAEIETGRRTVLAMTQTCRRFRFLLLPLYWKQLDLGWDVVKEAKRPLSLKKTRYLDDSGELRVFVRLVGSSLNHRYGTVTDKY
jgi:hypothetical protein